MSQTVKVAPFSPSSARQEKMPQTIFCSDKGAMLEKVSASSGLKIIHLTPDI
jgi:hypothetical protein